jgi:EAL domain-containing protein (putative c-di-GMP-specific phosphodiesterase class I)
MVEFPRTVGLATAVRDPSAVAMAQQNADGLQGRSELLREINLAREGEQRDHAVFLVVINIADTKRYDEIIRVFGYKFADDLLSIRLADLDFIRKRQPAFHVGFWSVGLVFHARNHEDYESALRRLIEVLAQPVICRGIPVSIRAGVGVCDLKRGLGAAEDLLQATFLAGQAGALSPAGWAECNYELEDDHRRAFSLISHAGHSLSTPYEFQLSYQARIELKTGKCDTVEALLRWRHPTLGMVMPSEFIPLIEMTGLVRELTFWVLSYAIAQAAKWHASGHKLKICVNISKKNLEEADFSKRVEGLLELNRLPAAFLELEFSERDVFTDEVVAGERLKELRELGVSISIDDFGTGSNGLASLENVPANVIKIDRRLVNSVMDRPKQQVLVKSLIRMAHELNMQVVAEGLETPAVLEMLIAWRCDYAQGYLINRPLPGDVFIEWYAKRFNGF